MPIQFKCKCGRGLEIDDRYAGKQAKCPSCGVIVDVPGTPKPPPKADYTDSPTVQIKAWVADSLEANPELTRVAIAMAIWQGALLVLMLFSSTIGWNLFLMWLFVLCPAAAFIGFSLNMLLNLDPKAPVWLRYGALGAGGAYWAYVFMSLSYLTQSPLRAGLMFMVSFVSVLGCAAVVWYFGAPRAQAEAVEVAELPEEDEPKKGSR